MERRRLPGPEGFHEETDPFAVVTSGCDLVYDHRHSEALIPPPAEEHRYSDFFGARHALPPQKLRPIRFHGRSPEEKLNQTPLSDAAGETVGALDGLPELGFSGNQECSVSQEVGGDCAESPGRARAAGAAESGDGMGPCTGPEIRGLGSGLGTVSDDMLLSYDDSSAEPGSRKRKRNSRKKLELYLESLVAKVMKKQERVHAQLIELIEKRDRERMLREEAWERQEIERIKREEDMRSQEMNRNVALISFIQNMLRHEIEIPQPLTVVVHAEETGSKSGGEVQKDANCDSYGKRWPDAAVQALIMLRTTVEDRFRPHKANLTGSKCSIWDKISAQMRNMGYNRSAKKCKEKWENINKYYRKLIESGKRHPDNSKSCSYFQELDILYKSGFMNTGSHAQVSPNIDGHETKIKGE